MTLELKVVLYGLVIKGMSSPTFSMPIEHQFDEPSKKTGKF